MNDPGRQTGDLADAIARADAKQLQLTLAIGLFVGSLIVLMAMSRELGGARRKERAEWAFAVDVLSDELADARKRFEVKPDGEAEEKTD